MIIYPDKFIFKNAKFKIRIDLSLYQSFYLCNWENIIQNSCFSLKTKFKF